MMATQAWRTSGNNSVISQKILRDAVYKDPRVLKALSNYVNSLRLDRETDSNRALQLFENALRNFTRDCHTKINQAFTINQFDQHHLSIPANMQQELQNPLSPLNIFLDTQIQIINDDIAQQTTIASNIADEDTLLQQTPPKASEEEENPIKDIEKMAALGLTLKIIDDADPKLIETLEKTIEKTFHDVTEIKGGDFDVKNEINRAEKEINDALKPTLKPQHDDVT